MTWHTITNTHTNPCRTIFSFFLLFYFRVDSRPPTECQHVVPLLCRNYSLPLVSACAPRRLAHHPIFLHFYYFWKIAHKCSMRKLWWISQVVGWRAEWLSVREAGCSGKWADEAGIYINMNTHPPRYVCIYVSTSICICSCTSKSTTCCCCRVAWLHRCWVFALPLHLHCNAFCCACAFLYYVHLCKCVCLWQLALLLLRYALILANNIFPRLL